MIIGRAVIILRMVLGRAHGGRVLSTRPVRVALYEWSSLCRMIGPPAERATLKMSAPGGIRRLLRWSERSPGILGPV